MFRRILHLFLILILAYILEAQLDGKTALWLLWSTLFFSFIASGTTFSEKVSIRVWTALIAAIAVFLSALIGNIFLLAALYLFLITAFASILREQNPYLASSFFMINLLAIFSCLFPVSFHLALLRAFAVLCGGIIVAVSYAVIWPYFVRSQIKSWLVIAITQLKTINQDIFNCFLELNYSSNIYLYERRLHVQKNRFLNSFEKIHRLVRLAEKKLSVEKEEQLEALIQQLDLIYEIMLDCASLRFRVTDYTIFEVCKPEMRILANELNLGFDKLAAIIAQKKPDKKPLQLLEKLQPLEDTYQHVMQVTSREPLVFVLFIYSLKKLFAAMEHFSSLEEKVKGETL